MAAGLHVAVVEASGMACIFAADYSVWLAESAGLIGCVVLAVFHLQQTCLECLNLVVVSLFTKLQI